MKKLIPVICFILAVMLLASCGSPSSGKPSGDNKTKDNKTTAQKTTEYVPSADGCEVNFATGIAMSNTVVFSFFAHDAKHKTITDASIFSGSIELVNDEGKTVYNGPAQIGSGMLGSFELSLDLSTVSIEPSSTPNGMAYCKLNVGGRTFEYSAAINNLPVSGSFVKMPSFPVTVNMYNTQGELQKSVTVEEPTLDVQSSFGDARLILEFSGSTEAISEYPGPYGGFTLKAYYNGQEIYNQKLRAAIDENGNFSGLNARVRIEGYNGGEVTLVIEDYR